MSAPSLDFQLQFVEGKGFLGLRDPARLPLATVDRLDLEVPQLRFPFDVTGGSARFRTRWCQLHRAELRVDDPRLREWLEGRTALERFGLSRVTGRVLPSSGVELSGRARVAERETAFTARLRLYPSPNGGGQMLSGLLEEVRLYGFLPAPAPLLGVGLLLGLGATPSDEGVARPGPAALTLSGQPIVTLDGIDRVTLNPLEVFLWKTLPESGFRLPRYRDLVLSAVEVADGRVLLRYGEGPAASSVEAAEAEARHRVFRPADLLLARGDLQGALDAYGRLDGADAEGVLADPQVIERRLAVLASTPARFEEAVTLASQLIERFPERAFPLVTLAAVEAERGEPARAGARFARAAELFERTGQPADARAAAFRAAEELARAGERAATAWLERVVNDPTDGPKPAASALLAERYAIEERWRDLLHLERRRLHEAEGEAQEARAHARLGQLYLERLADGPRAREELERALRLDESDGAVWTLYARALEAAGEPERALEALEQAAARSQDPTRSVDALLSASDLAEKAGQLEAALAQVKRALEHAPAHAVALGRAASLLQRLQRFDEAIAAFERAVEATSDDALRAPLYCELGRLERDARGDRQAARAWLERSIKLKPSQAAWRLIAELAEAEGKKDELCQALEHLAETGDREAPLKHARVLLELGRHHEAAVAAEAIATLRPEALSVLVQARAALGQRELEKDALERLVAATPDPEPRVRLSRLLADEGELDRARALCAEALPACEAGGPGLQRQALETLCDVLLRQGDDGALDQALGRLAQARPADEGRARALQAQGAARARLGLTAEAAESFRAALALEPDDRHARAGLAEAAWALKRWDEARAALEPLHEKGLPPRVERALRLGEICERQGQPAAAIGFYQAALEAGASGSDGIRAWNALIAVHHGRQDYPAEVRALLAAAEDERTNESDAQRATRLVQAGDLLRKHAGRPAEACEVYERALKLDQYQLAALDALEAIAEADGDVGMQAQVLGRKVAATARRPHQQKAILGRLATLQAEQLGRPDAARAAWLRALELDREYRPALKWLAEDARAHGDAVEETARLEQLIALAADPAEPEQRIDQLVRLGQLALAAGRLDAAEAHAKRALEAQPREPRALQLLDELYLQSGRTIELAAVLRARALGESDPEASFQLLERRARLLEATASTESAIAAYEELTTIRPQQPTPWTQLAALLRKAEAWPKLLAVLERLAAQAGEQAPAPDGGDGDDADGARRDEAEALWVEAAHLAHDRLNAPERAQAALERALARRPGSRTALQGLLQLARARGDAAEEDRLYGRLGDLEEEPRARARAVLDRALRRRERGDLEGALELIADLDPQVAPDGALKLRAEIEESRGRLAQATPALEALWERAQKAGDLETERWAVRRLSRLATQSGPTPAAEALFRRAVELDPDDREAESALAQVERARGDDRAYLESLERLLRTARRTFEGAQREAELGLELAEVHRRLGEPERAAQRLRAVLDAVPDHERALVELGRLERQRGAHAEAVALLERAAHKGLLQPDGRAALADSLEQLGEFGRAAVAWQAAGEAAPPLRRAEALERAGLDSEALAAYRQLGDEGVRRAARLQRKKAERAFAAGRTAEARVAALDALAGDPGDAEALSWATHGLSPVATLALLDELSTRISPDDAAALYRQVAATMVDEDARVALGRAATLSPDPQTLVALADRESGLEAARRYQQALQLDPGCAPAALGLARVGLPADAARALLATYDQVADAATRARLSAALGTIQRDRLGDTAAAREAFRAAAAESDARLGDLRVEILRSLAALERAGGDARAAEEALESLRSDGGAGDADLRHLAELYAERGAYAPAIELLSSLTEKSGPSELLFNCLEAAGRHQELLELLVEEAPRRMPDDARRSYLRAAALAAGPLGNPQKAVELYEKAVPLGPSDAELWARLGKLYAGPLADPDRAARCFARAYAADRERIDVLLPLADFHHQLGEWEPSTDYYLTALARNAVPPDELERVHLRLAEHARHRADALAEEESLRQAVTFGAGDRAWPRLAALYRIRGDRVRLLHALEHLAEKATGQEKANLLREAIPLAAPEDAADLDEQLLAEDPSDEAARDRILGRLRQAGDLAVLVARLERELPRAAPNRQGPYALELGRLAERLGDEPRAAEAFRAALKAQPTAEAARGLGESLARAGREPDGAAALEAALFDPRLPPGDRPEVARLAARAYLSPSLLQAGAQGSAARALQFFERLSKAGLPVQMDPAAYRALLRAELRFGELVAALDQAAGETWDPAEKLQLEIEAADVLDRELGQRDEAARRYAGLLDRHPTRRDLAERARQLYQAAGEPIHALAALDKEMRLAPPEDVPQLKIVRGELLLSAGADAEAEAEFLHALITTPRVGRAHAALAAVYKRRGDLAGALEHLIAAADAPDLEPQRAARCAVDAASVLLGEGDVATAERLYQLAAALDPADRDAVEGLARLAAARGEHERHADLLGRAVLLTSDRKERARLALERARLFQNELKRELDAYRAYKEAVACDPTLLQAARGLRELAEQRGEWALAAEQRYREIEAARNPEERSRLHLELARLLEEKLLDTEEALRNFEQAAEIALTTGGALARMAPFGDLQRLYLNAGRLADAAVTLDRQAETLTQPAESGLRGEALVRAAELYERAGDPQAAQARLERAAAIGGEAGRIADETLLRLADQGGDPAELRLRISERLTQLADHGAEGEEKLRLLRRLLELEAHLGDLDAVDARAKEVLERAPDDPVAFVERKRVLETRGPSPANDAQLAALYRQRAQAVSDPVERAARRFEAGRIAERLGNAAQATADYEAALGADPEHVPALDALADLAYRGRQLPRARSLYAQLGDRPSLLSPDEVLRRRAEVAEECGFSDEARGLYEACVRANPSSLQAHEALARLALGRGDEAGAFAELKAILDLLPLDAVDRITELRRQLGRLAVKLGELDQARNFLELVLAQDPDRFDVLDQLAVLYVDQQDWEAAADAFGRLSYLAERPDQRADLLFRKGEILRLGVEDEERAYDTYLKAADLHPHHAPTLRRLIAYYFREGELQQLTEVVRELESLNAPLDEAAVEAGLGIALGGDEARGTVIVAVSQPSAQRVAEALAGATRRWQPRDIAQLDPAIRAASRALGGGEIGRRALTDALRIRVAERPAELGARRALGRLYDLLNDLGHARTQYAVLTFVDPLGPAGTRLRELPPPTPLPLDDSQLVHPASRGPLRDALTAIGPLIVGLPPAPIEVDPSPTWTERLRGTARAMAIGDFQAVVVVELLDPAWAEPTRPPRLLLSRRALSEEAVARFATARAFHCLRSGVPLVEGRTPDEVGAFIRAAAAIFLPDLKPTLERTGAFVQAWESELKQLMPRPEDLPEQLRGHCEVQLATCVLDAGSLASASVYCAAERLTADRVAFARTGDLRAGLAALAPAEAGTPELRAQALSQVPAIVELLAFAHAVA